MQCQQRLTHSSGTARAAGARTMVITAQSSSVACRSSAAYAVWCRASWCGRPVIVSLCAVCCGESRRHRAEIRNSVGHVRLAEFTRHAGAEKSVGRDIRQIFVIIGP